MITKKDRKEQLRVIKYNHLIAVVLTFYNVYAITKSVKDLTSEGIKINPNLISKINPFRTGHVNRFGVYEILDRKLDDIDFELKV